MLILPSGRIVAISAHRTKHHALRLGGVMPDARHIELYSLIDVIYRYRDDTGQPRYGNTEYDFCYSGYTLANIHKASGWVEDDLKALFIWCRQNTQRNIIETTRRRLTDNQSRLSCKTNSAPSHLYSLLHHRICKLPLQKASVHQWQATLNNMRNTGLKDEELHYSGIQDFLKNNDDTEIIDKQKLLDVIDFKNIHIQLSTELIRGTKGQLNFQELAQRMSHQATRRATLKLDEDCLCVLRYHDVDTNYRVGVIKTIRMEHPLALNKYWFALDPYGRAISPSHGSLYYSNSDDAIKAANQDAATHYRGRHSGYRFHTHYGHLTLYGGYDYREWTVNLSEYQRLFFGPHHYDHNVLVHIRTTTRVDIHGKRILFIEEVQSDWHQQGKRHGYDNNPWGSVANAPYKKEWPLLAAKLMLIRASQNGYDAIAWPRGEIQELRYGRKLPAISRRYDREIPSALNKLCRPFSAQVSTTCIETCEPWLNIIKENNKWGVQDGFGKFKTRTRYHSREAAMEVLYRHSRHIALEVPALFISSELRYHIATNGLPLFGVKST